MREEGKGEAQIDASRSLRCNVLKMRRYHKPRGGFDSRSEDQRGPDGQGGPGPYDCLTVVRPASLDPATVRHKGLKQRCDSRRRMRKGRRELSWRCGLGFIY